MISLLQKLERACYFDKESEAVLGCLHYEQCAGPQKVSKFRFSKMLTEICGPKTSIAKNEHNIGFENLFFSFLAWIMFSKK